MPTANVNLFTRLADETGRGFFWMKELVGVLDNYENDRDKYPTLESYLPVLVGFYGNVASESGSMD